MTSAEIRKAFIDFFVTKHGHTFVPSSPVVPLNDPTLLFTNAGMNQFKPIFLGQEKRSYTRAVNTQKCIRAGGKHNDLDDVGRSRRHHTFFEMLGNWSFGDYFKQGAIEMSWELLTRVWGLDPERIHVSCFEGDPANGVPRDEESADIWHTVCGIPRERIHYFGKDNFWEMGDTGPCGPCTEIYYDRTPDKSGGQHVNGDDPRVMEIWNNVFIQYNRNPDRSLTVLPAKHVDTGMGFERICQVLQNKQSNYDIDLFDPYWVCLQQLSGHTYGGRFPRTNAPDPVAEAADADLRRDIAFRVITDHVRCLTFALTDGAVPGNEGRGYVLRRILRRAVRFGRQQLGLSDPFLYQLVDVVVETMGEAFPELKANPSTVKQIIREEEISFGRTLDRGIALFIEAADRARDQKIDAEDAWRLYDTFGFPIDLTQQMAAERGLTVDMPGFADRLEQARQIARSAARQGESPVYDLPPATLTRLEQQGVATTDDQAKYTDLSLSTTIAAIWDGQNLIDQTQPGQIYALILDRTCFYAEMGGQVGDTGKIVHPQGTFVVQTTRSVGGYVLHIGQSDSRIRRGDRVTISVDSSRHSIQQHHTATHLLNWALRETLGEGVQQKGSLVEANRLRFDFSHGKPLTESEMARVESLVTERISQDLTVYTQSVPQEQAIQINGLRAVFGEKYPPVVRVVSIGAKVEELLKDPHRPDWRNYSVEFCGGTHVSTTQEIQDCVVVSEEGVSKGVRRIVALAGKMAESARQIERQAADQIELARNADESDLLAKIAALQKIISSDHLPLRSRRQLQSSLIELQNRHKAWEKQQKRAQASNLDAGSVAQDLIDQSRGPVIVSVVADATDEQLRSVIDAIKSRLDRYAVLLGSTSGTNVIFVAAVSEDLIKTGLKAGDWVKQAARETGGGGGGRPNLAQGSGKDPGRLTEALEAARTYVLRFV
jgi:alanyl-tRNA synthetase